MPLQADAVAVVFLYFGAILLMAACDVVAERFSAVLDVSMPVILQSDGGENNFWYNCALSSSELLRLSLLLLLILLLLERLLLL